MGMSQPAQGRVDLFGSRREITGTGYPHLRSTYLAQPDVISIALGTLWSMRWRVSPSDHYYKPLPRFCACTAEVSTYLLRCAAHEPRLLASLCHPHPVVLVPGILSPSLREWAGRREVPTLVPTLRAAQLGRARVWVECATRAWPAASRTLRRACRSYCAAVGWLPLYPSRHGAYIPPATPA
eukprot:6185609-Pleurochrysis_carterae.AAC.1